MSHNIMYSSYQEKVNRKEVQAEWDEYVRKEDWQEGASGLVNPIRWIEGTVYETREDAEKAIERLDKGWYDQLAVKYKDNIYEARKTEKQKELEQKVKDTYEEYRKRNDVIYPKTRTSEYIGCSNCKSKLASKYLNGNRCPVCYEDLRPESTLKSIFSAETKWKKAQESLKEYVNKHSKKEIRWLVKIEYHT